MPSPITMERLLCLFRDIHIPTSLSNGPSLRGRLLRIQRPGLRRFARPRFAPQFRFVARWLFLPGGDGSPCFTTAAARTACSPRSCTSCASAIDGSSQNKERRGEKLRRRWKIFCRSALPGRLARSGTISWRRLVRAVRPICLSACALTDLRTFQALDGRGYRVPRECRQKGAPGRRSGRAQTPSVPPPGQSKRRG